jgi:hypothetical protein
MSPTCTPSMALALETTLVGLEELYVVLGLYWMPLRLEAYDDGRIGGLISRWFVESSFLCRTAPRSIVQGEEFDQALWNESMLTFDTASGLQQFKHMNQNHIEETPSVSGKPVVIQAICR